MKHVTEPLWFLLEYSIVVVGSCAIGALTWRVVMWVVR